MIPAYLILAAIAAAMLAATICTVTRAGEKDGVCKYDTDNDGER